MEVTKIETVFIVFATSLDNAYGDWDEESRIVKVFTNFEAAKSFIECTYPKALFDSESDRWIQDGKTEYFEYREIYEILQYKVES